MKERILVVAAFVLTFAVGVLTGAIIVREFTPMPFQRTPWLRAGERPFPPGGEPLAPPLEILQQRLGLSEAQRQQVAVIVEKYREQLHRHLSQMRPKTHEIIQQMRTEIESVLTPAQREKFQKDFPQWRRPPLWPKDAPPPDTTIEIP